MALISCITIEVFYISIDDKVKLFRLDLGMLRLPI